MIEMEKNIIVMIKKGCGMLKKKKKRERALQIQP